MQPRSADAAAAPMAATSHPFAACHVLPQPCLIWLMEAAQHANVPKAASVSRAAVIISARMLELALGPVRTGRKTCQIGCDRAEICAAARMDDVFLG